MREANYGNYDIDPDLGLDVDDIVDTIQDIIHSNYRDQITVGSDHFVGPYEVSEKVGPVTNRLAGMGQKSEIVHADRLKPWRSLLVKIAMAETL